FFQAEDGIRDYKVTGVQTCALPIFARKSKAIARICESGNKRGLRHRAGRGSRRSGAAGRWRLQERLRDEDRAEERHRARVRGRRSEERRVGKECRSGRGREE